MSAAVDIRRESAEELASLYERRGHGLPEKLMTQEEEPLGKLAVAPEAFQFRKASDRSGAKELHVRRLVQALEKQDSYFDPLLLFAIAGHRLVLDGHCRLQAYLRADLDPATTVPVSYFRGDFSEALTRPASMNSKAKLPLTQEEQLEAAWKLVLFDERRGNYSLREIARFTGAGKSTAAKMRNVLERDGQLGFDPRLRTWKEVKRGRREEREIDPHWKQKRANGVAPVWWTLNGLGFRLLSGGSFRS